LGLFLDLLDVIIAEAILSCKPWYFATPIASNWVISPKTPEVLKEAAVAECIE
jgi:hypothetical protein